MSGVSHADPAYYSVDGYPLVLIMTADPAIRHVAVYQDIQFGSAVGIAPFGEGLAVLVLEHQFTGSPLDPEPRLTLYRTTPEGSRLELLWSYEDAFPHRTAPLRAASDGGLFVGLSWLGRVKLDAAGNVVGTYTLDGAALQHLVEMPGGDLIVAGPRIDSPGYVLARLASDGSERWRALPPYIIHDIVAHEAGFTILRGGPYPEYGESRLVIAHFDDQGKMIRERTVLGTLTGGAGGLAMLPDGGFAISYYEDYRPGQPGHTRAWVARLGHDGRIRWRAPFGPERGSTDASAPIPLRDGRFAAAATTGPETLDGHGTDHTDIVVAVFGP